MYQTILFGLLFLLINTEVAKSQTRFRGMTASTPLTGDYDDLRTFGANLVSFQISNSNPAGILTDQEYAKFIDAKLIVLDSILSTCEENGLKVLVVLHFPPGSIDTSGPLPLHRLFFNSQYEQSFLSTWIKIATRYKGRKGIWGYDLLNEPAIGRISTGIPLLTTLNEKTITEIRSIDPDVRIVLEPPYGNPDLINKLARTTFGNITYSIHSYFSSAFRNQGLNGRPINISYPRVNKKNPKKGFNRTTLKQSVSKAATFQRVRGKPPILVGEFAAPRWAPQGSAARYIRDSISIFERYKWDWTNHAWREADVWSPEHVSDPSNPNPSAVETDRARVLRKAFAKNR